jgi:hypothetical protein
VIDTRKALLKVFVELLFEFRITSAAALAILVRLRLRLCELGEGSTGRTGGVLVLVLVSGAAHGEYE